MDWDSTSYTDAPHCIRSFDTNLLATAGASVHDRRPGLEPGALGDPAAATSRWARPRRAWDTTLIDSQFDYAPDTSFSAAAKATYDAALARDGPAGGERSSRPGSRPAASRSEPSHSP